MHNKRTGRIIPWILLIIVIAAAAFGGGVWAVKEGLLGGVAVTETPKAAKEKQLYTCGMHPQVIQEGPGNCPICGMKLTPMKKGEQKEIKDETAAEAVLIDPATVQNMGIRTTVLQRGPLVKTIRTVGRVDYDEQRVDFITTKFEGWIEKLYVDQTGQHVNKGDPLFDVYSRELYAAQEEYFAAVRGLKRVSDASESVREQARDLLEAARVKLKYMDVSEEQIDKLAQTEKIQKNLTIHSPAEGIVTEKMALEGMYIKPGMRLYTIADLGEVWVYVDVYEYQLPWVKIGQDATMTLPYIPGEVFEGRVVYIYPYLEEQTRVVKIRLEFENPTLQLKPDMFANIRLQSQLDRDALLIPRQAYIDSGKRQVAFEYLGDGRFQPREIQVGVEGEGGMVEVLSGLKEGDRIVTSGQFLLDSESKLIEAVAKMTGRKKEKEPVTKPVTKPAIPADAKYVCPMKQCNYFSDKPGNCPECGMNLKPIEEVEWARELAQATQFPAGVTYICPMHPDVERSVPGTCPVCAMQLVRKDRYKKPATAPAAIRQQLDHVTEHYLALQRRFASDTTDEVALHALGVAAAAQSLLESLEKADIPDQKAIHKTTEQLRAAALQIKGTDIDEDRLHFGDLSEAMRMMLRFSRPNKDRWPELHVFYCPMCKGYWVQTTKEPKNPYYGYKMLKCGELKETR